jgi:phage terminase large subunit
VLSQIELKERLRGLPRERQEELYRRYFAPEERRRLEAEVAERKRTERGYAPLDPGEYGGDPVGWVRGDEFEAFDYMAPDYAPLYALRDERLARLRTDPRLMGPLREFYRERPADFISDWGMTFDPRNADVGLPASIPFVLFPRQREWIDFVVECWKNRQRGLTEKSRESGVSWLAVSLSCTLALLTEGFVAGFGSRLAEYVDAIGEPKSLFWKARAFVSSLPPEFRGSWDPRRDTAQMRIRFPDTNSMLSGEQGDNIGRGSRTSIYFIDESAHLEHPQLAEASLSSTTNCRQDISTPAGLGGPFEQLRHSGRVKVFTFHWKDDPRKDDAWYAKQRAEAFSPAIVAQELDIDYAASVEGVVIPHAWVLAAFDAHEKLGIEPTGKKSGGFDVADEGGDLLAFAVAHGVVVEWVEEWAGKGSDIYASVERAFRICDHFELEGFRYDSDGMGASCRGDARRVNEHRSANGQPARYVTPFRSSEAPYMPEAQDVKGRKNKDMFRNRKAQAWWSLRERFRVTYRALVPDDETGEVTPAHRDEIISLSRSIDEGQPGMRLKLTAELSQPVFKKDPPTGKMEIDKAPEGTRSPNLADALMILYARTGADMRVTHEIVARSQTGFQGEAYGQQNKPKPVVGSGLFVSNALLQRSAAAGPWTNRGR